MIGISIPTYQRKDGTTPFLLSRALESVKNQSYQDYKVFLIGDDYKDKKEFIKLASSIIPSNKIYFENLPIAIERNKYPTSSKQLWCSGGANARNYIIDLALSDNINYLCPLDHDDYWHPQHLEFINYTINLKPNSSFIYTCGTYFNHYLPNQPLTNEIISSFPTPGEVIHSSVCINHKLIPLKYRDVFEETRKLEPSDADLWFRSSQYIKENNLESYLITSLTCFHPQENI
jgi:glycosyltransferase involved in cell wall biosynthesis